MDTLFSIIALVSILVVIGQLAGVYGADTRDGFEQPDRTFRA